MYRDVPLKTSSEKCRKFRGNEMNNVQLSTLSSALAVAIYWLRIFLKYVFQVERK